MSQTKEVGKDLIYQHEKKRNALYLKIIIVVASSYFFSSYLIDDNLIWFYNPIIEISENPRDFVDYFISVAAVILSFWIYFYYNGKLKTIFDSMLSIVAFGGAGRIKKISDTMIYQQPFSSDGLKRNKEKMVLFSKKEGSSISSFFNHEKDNPTTSRIVKYFRSNQHYIDYFKIIEGYLNNPKELEKQVDVFYDYNIQDENSNKEKIAQSAKQKRIDYKAFSESQVQFSAGIVKYYLNLITQDFSRYIDVTATKPTSSRRAIKAMKKQEINKMVDVFSFVIFHKIITNFVNIPTGLVESKLDDYDFRRIINSYQIDGFTIELSKDNNGSNKSFSNDTFSSVFLTLYNKYMSDGSKNINVNEILKRFDPLNDIAKEESNIFDIKAEQEVQL